MRALAWLFPLLFLAFHPQSTTKSTPAQNTQGQERPLVQDSEEYAVYSLILNSQQASPGLKQFVINSLTMSKAETPFIGFVGGLAPSGARPPTTETATMSDFTEKDEKSCLLDKHFALKIPYVLATDEQLKALFVTDADGHIGSESWSPFYEQYPGAAGIIAFSRVGFNAKKDQALVYVVQQRGLVGGIGRFLVLSKNGGTWKIDKEVVMFLS